jgi:hypothetical protein
MIKILVIKNKNKKGGDRPIWHKGPLLLLFLFQISKGIFILLKIIIIIITINAINNKN